MGQEGPPQEKLYRVNVSLSMIPIYTFDEHKGLKQALGELTRSVTD
jgi:hypothetical protein